VKIAVLQRPIYRFNVVPIKIPTPFFTEIEKSVLKFTWKHKKALNSPNNSKQKKQNGGVTIPDFKLHYRTTVIKPAWYRHKNKHIDQWNRIEDPEIRDAA
jgi:hypothetical protein